MTTYDSFQARSGKRVAIIDVLLVTLALFAGLMLTGVGGFLAILLALSVVGLPVAFLLFVSVPLIVVLGPLRLGYAVFRLRFGVFLSLVGAAVIGALSFAGVDAALRAGPDTAAAEAFVGPPVRVVPIALPDGATVAFDLPSLDEPGACGRLCQSTLEDPRVASVIMIRTRNDAGIPRGLLYTRLPDDGRCALGAVRDQMLGAPSNLCKRGTDLTGADVVLSERAITAPDGIDRAWVLTLRQGAMTQSVRVVIADMGHGGGLMHPHTGGTLGEDVDYFARVRPTVFAAFDPSLTARGYSSRNPLQPTYLSLMKQALASPG